MKPRHLRSDIVSVTAPKYIIPGASKEQCLAAITEITKQLRSGPLSNLERGLLVAERRDWRETLDHLEGATGK
jgi:hypothetical protein